MVGEHIRYFTTEYRQRFASDKAKKMKELNDSLAWMVTGGSLEIGLARRPCNIRLASAIKAR